VVEARVIADVQDLPTEFRSHLQASPKRRIVLQSVPFGEVPEGFVDEDTGFAGIEHDRVDPGLHRFGVEQFACLLDALP